jgi:hypothetical protein
MIRSIIQSILDAVRSNFTLEKITKYDDHQGYLITISHYSEKDSYLLADLSYIMFELERVFIDAYVDTFDENTTTVYVKSYVALEDL